MYREDFVTFYHYPKEHWIHLADYQPVRVRFQWGKAEDQCWVRRRDNALYLVFKIIERLSKHWRPLNGGVNLMALVLEGEFQRWHRATP